MQSRIIAIIFFCLNYWPKGDAACFFPSEFQGEFVTQSSQRGETSLQYSPVTILPESIPVWGICHRRMGNKVLLTDRTGGINCIRCFQLTLRSLNIVQIHTEGVDKCHNNEITALASCPTDESIVSGQSREIMLYKTKELTGDTVIAQEYCPLNGRYVFTYSVNDGTGKFNECSSPISELSNCPYGFGLGLRFKRCTFGDLEINFQCLGDWIGHNGERYMALLDVQDPSLTSNSEKRPRYRCALYKEDPETGKMFVALSSDSTCRNDLRSPTDGFETLTLNPVSPPPLPFEVSTSACRFPMWAHGQWQDAYVEADTIVYKDLRNFRTYTVKCMVEEKSVESKGHPEQDFFVVYARTQCGDDFYTCLTMDRRGVNVMEFQLGMHKSSKYNQTLCQNEDFTPAWVTQGRINVISEEACPISGEYVGMIPDAIGLCAKLFSDCRNPQKLFYTVSNCNNNSEIYQEREYRCLGLWNDNGLTYTYTERRDILGYECFVGVLINDAELFIKEAGENCQRDVEPLKLGMKLSRQATCYTPLTHLKANTITTPPSATIRYDVDNNDDIKMDIRNPDDFSPHVVSTPIERNVSAGLPKEPTSGGEFIIPSLKLILSCILVSTVI